ncbi:uncharacterized protein LOC116214647 [Punica granatum]|uniref:BSD domain-containing protein n=2 Tax=Punica granatum TaxID=22663 RepID=A0A218WEK1_PUNGR|nr:uncharacterized protein LOC116214647 [Punica granatum]OWM70770.1 hypothetical protein CDL15_Pgr014443 [Punica granatum]PKI41708.1 hypothetical protein CRG98_037910 [Punica granatum]
MAWLARSLADSLRLDEDGADAGDGDDGGDEEGEDWRGEERRENDPAPPSPTDCHGSLDRDRSGNHIEGESAEEWQSRGVKEDLNELTQTLTRQLWGVANFLAPPPSQPTTPSHSDPGISEWDRFGTPGRRSNSSSEGREPMEEAAKEVRSREMDVGLEPIESEGEYGEEEEEFEEVELIGVTDEVLAFARNIAMHPETWLDFPLDAEDDLDDFKMSDAQQQHARAIENLALRLRALRIELCPCHMSESYFWKVYFVLLHSRLEKHNADILSTPQVMEARAMWMKELKEQTKPEFDWPEISTYHFNEYERDDMQQDEAYPGSPNYFTARSVPFRSSAFEPERSSTLMHTEIEEHPTASLETQTVDKSVTGENTVVDTKNKDSPRMPVQSFDDDDDDDDWPEEEYSDLVGFSGAVASMGIEEDISFSDLEDDIDVSMPIRSKSVSDGQEKRNS